MKRLFIVFFALIVGCSSDSGFEADVSVDTLDGDAAIQSEAGVVDAAIDASIVDRADSAPDSALDASSTDTPLPRECIPLSDAANPNPTPGRCEDNVALTCDQDGRLARVACAPGSECTTYPLQVWRYADGWIEHLVVEWAGCRPTSSEACALIWTGTQYVAEGDAACSATDVRRCVSPPTPDLNDLVLPQLRAGTTGGWLVDEACPDGQMCVGAGRCIDERSEACAFEGTQCDGDSIASCRDGFVETSECRRGETCYEGDSGPFCRGRGESRCDGDAPYCSDARTRVGCYDGWTETVDCSTCYDAREGKRVPCRCEDDLVGAPTSWERGGLGATCDFPSAVSCIPTSDADCVTGVDADFCDGSVAHRCRGRWVETDCSDYGMVCGVGDGIAGCRHPEAAACSGVEFVCDAESATGCCTCGYVGAAGVLEAPCVPGFEATETCLAGGGCTTDFGCF